MCIRKLDNKGFTLVELLAVIAILAIITAVSVPSILSISGNAKQDIFDESADTMATYFASQYQLAMIGEADEFFTELCGTDGALCEGKRVALTGRAILAAGGEDANYNVGTISDGNMNLSLASAYTSASSVKILSNGGVCVILHASSDGQFAKVSTKVAKSKSCGLDN